MVAAVFLDLSEIYAVSCSLMAASRPNFHSRKSGDRSFGHLSQWPNVQYQDYH